MVDETSLKFKLLEDELVEQDLLDAAQDRKTVYGGDLASQLLIMGAVSESDLLGALAELKGVAAADPNEYDRIDPDALETIERPLLLEYSIIPFQKHRRNLGIFVVEPLGDEALSHLSETHGVRITQYIWPRIRFHQTIAALLDEPLPDWAEDFDDDVELSFAEDLRIPEGSGEDLAANSSPAIGRPVSDPHLEPDEVEFSELGIGWSCDQMVDFVKHCYNRDAVLHALLGYADWWLEHRMVLVLGKDSIQPYLIAGWSELPDEFRDVDRLRQLRVPVDPSAPIFDQEQVGHFLADKPEDVGLGDLFVELTLFPPDRLLNQSVKIGDRPYMLLVGEPRDRLPTAPPGIDRLEEVAIQVGEQLESIIRAAKTDGLPPEGERIPALPDPDGDFDVEVGAPEELEEPDEIEEPPEEPKLEVEDNAPSGRTLDGTGESFANLKDEVDEAEMSAPQLGGESEPNHPRQTQHISQEESESIVSDGEDISAPQLDTLGDDARQTQGMPPGSQESSSVVDDAEPALGDAGDVSSTSFGIPFADAGENDDGQAEDSDANDASSTTFGFGFVDDQDAESSAAEVDTDDADEESEPQDGDDSEKAPRKDPSLPEFDVENSNATMMGGFEVSDSHSSYAEQVKRRESEAETAEPNDDFDPDDFSDEDGPSLESLGSGNSFASEESSASEELPGAKIVRFTSLANGRKTLQESSVEEEPDPEDIPKIEPSSEDLDSGSVAFTDDDLEETADLLDSRNPANAFNAAEQIVEWGGKAVQELSKRFPGRLFVDRHEHTQDTLPPVDEHGPVIAALAMLGDRAVSVVEDHLEDSSIELRFYATLLFEELPIDSVTEKLIERLFDRDKMIRDVAADILVKRTDDDFKEEKLLPRLRDEVESARDDVHVEIAARLLGRMRDRYAVPTLIEALEDASGRVQQTIQGALATITYKKLSPSVSEWRNWWSSAHENSRQDWIIEALNHDSEDVRRLVHFELKNWDDLDIDYHPEQPKKLRMRAQEQLREWFEGQE